MDTIKQNNKVKLKPEQRVKYFDHIGKIKFGKYKKESKSIKHLLTRHIVIEDENGITIIIPISKVWSYEN